MTDHSTPAPFDWPMWALELAQVAPSAPQARKGIETVFRQYRPLMAERDRLQAENETLKAEVQRITEIAMARDDVLFEIGKALEAYKETLFSPPSDEQGASDA